MGTLFLMRCQLTLPTSLPVSFCRPALSFCRKVHLHLMFVHARLELAASTDFPCRREFSKSNKFDLVRRASSYHTWVREY